MLKKHSFVKKTRAGKVVKVVREHYLRDDITCGSLACTRCAHLTTPVLGPATTITSMHRSTLQHPRESDAEDQHPKLDDGDHDDEEDDVDDDDDVPTTTQPMEEVREYVLLDTNVVLHQIDLLEHTVRSNTIQSQSIER